jgi:hypothetical protein
VRWRIAQGLMQRARAHSEVPTEACALCGWGSGISRTSPQPPGREEPPAAAWVGCRPRRV